MNKSGIYYIQNCINGKLYIGQAVDINRRKTTHFRELRRNLHFNQHLQNSFNKYGEDNFEFGIIQLCDKSELDELETYYIKLYDTQIYGFNICDGGESRPFSSGENHYNWRDDISNDMIQEMYEAGYSTTQIATSCGCSQGTICRRLKMIFGEEAYVSLAKERQIISASKNCEKRANARKKYTLWDGSTVHYRKGRGEGTRCFSLKHNHKPVNIGMFHDFTSVDIISKLIEQCIE